MQRFSFGGIQLDYKSLTLTLEHYIQGGMGHLLIFMWN